MLASKIAKAPVQVANVEPFDKIAAARNITVTVSYTVVTAEGLLEGPDSYKALLTKRMWRGEDGTLVKQAAANPVRGTFTDIAHSGTADDILNAYADVLRSLSSHQAIIAAPLPSPFRERRQQVAADDEECARARCLAEVTDDVPARRRTGAAVPSISTFRRRCGRQLRQPGRPLSQGAASGMAGLRRSRASG